MATIKERSLLYWEFWSNPDTIWNTALQLAVQQTKQDRLSIIALANSGSGVTTWVPHVESPRTALFRVGQQPSHSQDIDQCMPGELCQQRYSCGFVELYAVIILVVPYRSTGSGRCHASRPQNVCGMMGRAGLLHP